MLPTKCCIVVCSNICIRMSSAMNLFSFLNATFRPWWARVVDKECVPCDVHICWYCSNCTHALLKQSQLPLVHLLQSASHQFKFFCCLPPNACLCLRNTHYKKENWPWKPKWKLGRNGYKPFRKTRACTYFFRATKVFYVTSRCYSNIVVKWHFWCTFTSLCMWYKLS